MVIFLDRMGTYELGGEGEGGGEGGGGGGEISPV